MIAPPSPIAELLRLAHPLVGAACAGGLHLSGRVRTGATLRNIAVQH